MVKPKTAARVSSMLAYRVIYIVTRCLKAGVCLSFGKGLIYYINIAIELFFSDIKKPQQELGFPGPCLVMSLAL